MRQPPVAQKVPPVVLHLMVTVRRWLIALISLFYRMFKTDLGLTETTKKLLKEDGWAFMARGISSNMTAVAAPIAMTIFITDLLMSNKKNT